MAQQLVQFTSLDKKGIESYYHECEIVTFGKEWVAGT